MNCHCFDRCNDIDAGRRDQQATRELRAWLDGLLDNASNSVPFVGYDVLGNERIEAVRELRKLPDKMEPVVSCPAHEWKDLLGRSLGLKTLASFGEIRDRLVWLIGGDQSQESVLMRLEYETGSSATPTDCPRFRPACGRRVIERGGA